MLIEREDFICEELDLVSTAETRPWRFACVFVCIFFLLQQQVATTNSMKNTVCTRTETVNITAHLQHVFDVVFLLLVYHAHPGSQSKPDQQHPHLDIKVKESHLVSVSSVKFYRNKLLFLFCKSCDWTLLMIRVRSSAYWFMWHLRRAVSTSFMCYKIISHKSYELQPRRSVNTEAQPPSW